MAAAVQPVIDAAPPDTCVGVGYGAESLYLHNGTAPLAPASNQKILTASAALDLLGPDETLKTTFASATPMANGVVEGDLFMIGGGDPVLTTDAYQARQQHGRFPETDLEAVADRLVADGLRQITGAVVGDASRYDAQRSLPDWKQRWQSDGTVAPLSALLVNDGWLIDPVTGEGSGGPASDPAQHAAAVMARLLTDRGVVIGSGARSGAAPADPYAIAEVVSPPMSTIVEEVLTFSDNTTAELLVKEMGVRSGATGSTVDGVAAVTDWARDQGVAEEGWVMVDGSGLSSANLVTCTMLAQLLRRAGPDSVLAEGLAVPGGVGTLEDRFTSGEFPTRLRAKTGTLNKVSALSGWFIGAADAPLDFEFVINTGDRSVGVADLGLQQKLLDALADQPVPPPLEAAGPLPHSNG
jgi:D-alanyl-D-alanine carboxypeptidase/D-alanyl-D-alanine-endopeptidase (penicillin-binding protein 4)